MNILEGRPFQRETILKTGVIDATNAERALQQWAELTLLDNKMQRLNHRIDESLAQYSNQKTILVLGILLVFILMVFAFVVLKAYFAKVKLNEQLEEKNREIEAATQAKLMFFTNVSHELRTPLTLIETPVEQLLAENQLSKVQRRLLEVAHRNVRTLLKLINQILDFRKVEGGKMTLQLAETNLAALVGNVVSEFVAAAEHKRIRLSCRLPEHISATIDAGKVESGVFAVNDKVKIYPSNIETTIKAIEVGGKEVQECFAPQSAVLHLADDIDISRGDLIAKEDNLLKTGQDIEALVCWMDEKPLTIGTKYLLQHNSKTVIAMVKEIRYRLDVNTLEKEMTPANAGLNEVVEVLLKTSASLSYDSYQSIRENGSAILIDQTSFVTVGAVLFK